MSSLSTITDDHVLPSTVGEMLREDFLEPLGLTPDELANKLHVSGSALKEVLHDLRAIDADLDLRLGRYFKISQGFFLAYQSDRDLRVRRYELGGALDQIIPRAA